jgi:6-phosphogluconolactonase (cycloisomerase 2 family)
MAYRAFTASKGPAPIAIHRSGDFADIGGNAVSTYNISPATGTLTSAGTVAGTSVTASMAMHPSGKVAYLANSVSNHLWTNCTDTATGALTLISSIGK